MQTRRTFLKNSATAAGLALLPSSFSLASNDAPAQSMAFGGGELFSLSDGHLNLPSSMVVPETLAEAEKTRLIDRLNIGREQYTPDCNVVLWKTQDRTILFDTGAGTQFSAGGGQLAASLELAGVDPYDVTDVVLTHAHPDHLWGILDDFDDLAFPDAQFHVSQKEWDYWLNPNTLSRTIESRKTFVVGAQNRLPLLSEQVNLFNNGQEILPSIEAVSTHGHTPGHSSFILHSTSNKSVTVVGDAIANAVVSFEHPSWPSGSDQNPEYGVSTRLALLDRLSFDRSLLIGYHLPAPGIGYAERHGKAYRFVTQ